MADSTDLLEAELAIQKGMHSLEEKKAAENKQSLAEVLDSVLDDDDDDDVPCFACHL